MALSIEHIGIAVRKPLEMVKWYEKVLGFETIVASGEPDKGVAFINDAAKKVVLEVMNAPGLTALCDRQDDPTQLHIAFLSETPDADADRLVREGAARIGDTIHTPAGDTLILLRDPWGNTVQLVKRAPGRSMGPK